MRDDGQMDLSPFWSKWEPWEQLLGGQLPLLLHWAQQAVEA